MPRVLNKSVKLEIKLDESQYNAGHYVTGHVMVCSSVPVQIHSLDVQLIGISQVLESDKEMIGRKPIKSRYHICPKSSIADNQVLAAGYNFFAFRLLLPTYCPSSFKHHHGTVSWKCGAQLHSNVSRSTTYKQFTVQGQSADFPFAEIPQNVVKQKVLGGQLTMEGKLDKGGYIPGEEIDCTIDIDTKRRPLRKIHMEIVQKQTFTLSELVVYSNHLEQQLSSHSHEEVITEKTVNAPSTAKGGRLNAHITIPSKTISTYCPEQTDDDLYPVTIEYFLRIKATIGLSTKIEIRLPFMVGCELLENQYQSDSVELNLLPSHVAELKEWIEYSQNWIDLTQHYGLP